MSKKLEKRSGRNVLFVGLCMSMVFVLMVPGVGAAAAAANKGGEEFVTFFVAPNGNDSNSGQKSKPFKTLEAARNAIRSLKSNSGLPEGGVRVYLREGEYPLKQSFQLGSEDSGEIDKPIVYAAYPGEKVQILGGVALPGNMFQMVTNTEVQSRLQEAVRDDVVQINLKELGITDYGAIRQGGTGPFENIVNPELFFNGESMKLSRYPNNGYLLTGDIVVKGGNPRGDGPAPDKTKMAEEFKKGHTFKYTDPRPNQWVDTGDIWMFGYFYWDWADGNLNISKIDKDKQEISTKTASYYGIRSNQRYYYYNILEEIDQPGEWYLDRSTGILYFYPPSDVNQADIKLSTMEDPLFLLDGASHITLDNLELGYTRGTAVMIKGGDYNKVAGSTIKETGGFGVTIEGGKYNGVLSSDIYETGIGGISLAGGDRQTLTPGNNYVRNNDIHSFSRIKATYSPAVALQGVGNIVSNNRIHDAPHYAIAISGNNHLIEYNEIYNVLTETGDSGAIYMGRDWSQQGNIIRYNYLHDLHNDVAKDQVAIYLDDMASGTHVYGNLIVDVYRPILVGGGRDNNIQENVILHGTRSAVYIDNRAMGWAAKTAKPGGLMYQSLQAMPYQQPPWSDQYPHLVHYLEDEPAIPKYNVVTDNVIYDNPVGMEINQYAVTYGTVKDNLIIPRNRGISSDDMDRFNKIVNDLPLERYGLYNDKYRHDVKASHNIAALKAMKKEVKNGSKQVQNMLQHGFTEDFEDGLSLWSTGAGTPKTDTVQAHSGTYSFSVDEDREFIFQQMPELLNRKVSLWLYDNASDTTLAVVARVDDSKTIVALGVNTNVTKDKYVFRVGGTWTATDIARTNGWHQLTFDYSSGSGVSLSIDDTPVHTATEITGFDRIGLGDEWADRMSGPVYFDDVVVSGMEQVKSKQSNRRPK